jgi:hypothetical protein
VSHPFLIVRATIEDEVMPEFVRWYREEHLPHVMAIPGVQKAYRSRCGGNRGNWTTLYQLADDVTVQQVLSSSEADQARRDWERWLSHVSELTVEVYAPLAPMPALIHRWN